MRKFVLSRSFRADSGEFKSFCCAVSPKSLKPPGNVTVSLATVDHMRMSSTAVKHFNIEMPKIQVEEFSSVLSLCVSYHFELNVPYLINHLMSCISVMNPLISGIS